ncbi:MAG TPA: DUF4365 domain-containing protein [Ignavibacteria bacterium]|nr:DUF4365 domain-containing protein [Ignavibacteria bacterium]HMQ99803.1 DUF4365 domain-containing protein [Ignavibacteria bacterium]
MPTKRKNTKKTENQGVLYVQNVINDSNCIFNKIDTSNDIGLDGYLEFVERETVSGLCLGVQIKSGNSNKNKQNYVTIKSDKEHFEYWFSHNLPIVGIVYIPEDSLAYWIDITEYLRLNENIVETGPYVIHIGKENVFTSETFPQFYEKLIHYKNSFNQEWSFGRALKSLADFHSKDIRFDALKSLFYFHRNEPAAWYYIINQFKIETDSKIQYLIIYLMRHLTNHGDIFWHNNNIIQQDTRTYGREIITKLFSNNEIYKLLNFIDENGIDRGSVGQDIYAIIDLINNKIEILKEIILRNDCTDEIRFWAGMIIIEEIYPYDLRRAINFCESMINNFPDSPYKANFVEIGLNLLEEEQIQ